ncbi:TetR family transcriptional regulator [Streptomonospora sediminis]
MEPDKTNTERLWTRSRRAAYAEITDVAMNLFLDNGFDATTIDDIAGASGISRRSFFRYFGTKEDIVLGRLAEDGEEARRVLESRPGSEPPWSALCNTLWDIAAPPQDQERMLKVSKMMYGTPSLRARSIEKHLQWQEQLVPEVRRRLGGAGSGGTAEPGSAAGTRLDVQAGSLVACAIACLDSAGEAWTREDGRVALAELLDAAFSAVDGARRNRSPN